MRQIYFRYAAKAFMAGHHQIANEYTAKGQECTKLMKYFNELAADRLFDSKKRVGNSAVILDLHHLYVDEAIRKVAEELDYIDGLQLDQRPKSLEIITGIGSNSLHGKPKIRPAVLEYLRNHNYRCRASDGSVTVFFQTK